MAYISVLVPAFYFNTTDKATITQSLSLQFDSNETQFDLIELKIDSKLHYAVKLKDSDLSLASIEELIYQRDCIKAICEKTFESLKAMTAKLTEGERELKTFINKKKEGSLVNENVKLKDLFINQKELSENFRQNTEKTLTKIKEGLQTMVMEFESIKKKTMKSKEKCKAKTKAGTQREQREFGLKHADSNNISNSGNNNNNSNSNSNNRKHEVKGNGVPKLNFNK